jgi:hypothetical protein
MGRGGAGLTTAPHGLAAPEGLELCRLQLQLEALYQLEPTPPIVQFVRTDASAARERVLVRQLEGALELAVELPPACLAALVHPAPHECMDDYLGAVEGVSHFIHLVERARTGVPTTLLELELQAEVDKFAVLSRGPDTLLPHDLRKLHRRLYEDVVYLHAPGTELGRRYRMANDLAARLWAQLIDERAVESIRSTLRRFYRASQADKIRMVCVA